LPLLATNGVCYAIAQGRQLCDAFTAIRNHRTLSTAGRLLTRNAERFLKSPQEMQQLFADLPEAIANTLELSSRLEFTLNDLGYEFPRYPVPEGETMNSFLRERAWEGFRKRYGPASQNMQARARRQIERELSLIEKLNLAGYFLIVWDLVRLCREHGTALRAFSFRRTRRMARHRSRPAQRRRTRKSHPVCLPALRRTRRRHDQIG